LSNVSKEDVRKLVDFTRRAKAAKTRLYKTGFL